MVSSANSEFVEHVEHLPGVTVVVDHRVVVRRLPQPRLAQALRLGVGEDMHVGEVAPREERVARRVLSSDVVDGGVGDLVVDGLHPLSVEWPGVLDGLLAGRTVLRVVWFARNLIGGFALQDSPRVCKFVQQRELVFVRIVELFGFLFGVEMVQIAEELVEPVHRR